MSSKPTHIFESGLGGDWADEEPTPQEAKGAPKKGWGAPPKKDETPAVDLRKIQQEERKDKPLPKPQVYQRPQPREDDSYSRPRDDYGGPPRRDYGQGRDNYDSRPRDDYGGPPRRDYDSRPRDDYSGPPRRDYDSRPRDDYGGPPRRDYDHDRPPREELPVPDHPPFIARLGNLNYDMTDEYFTEFFQDLGIVSATIIRDQKTGRSKGFGFVEFTTREGLENALSCNGSEDMFMDRPFQVSVHAGKKEQPRYGFGPRDGEEPKSFRRDPDKPFEPAGRSFYGGRDNDRYGSNNREFGKGFREERSFDNRPTGPPSLNLKPRSEGAAPVQEEPKKPSKLSEDPFGGVTAPDEDKIKRIQEEREKREQEKEQKRKEELERIKAEREKERQDKLAKIEAEKKQREEKQNQSWKSDDKRWGNNKPAATGTGGGWGDNKHKDTSWGPKEGAPAKSWGDKKPHNQEGSAPSSENQGIGRGRGYTPKDNHEGGGRGRGDRKPQSGGRGRGDSNPKGPGPKNSNPKGKNQQTTDAPAEGGDAFQTPAKQAPASYKAALGAAGTTTTDKKATENPFAALHQGQADEEQED